MRYSKLIVVLLGALGMQLAGATPTAEEAAQLGKTLTPMGAIKAGNKEGTIPEWTGGVCTPPAGYKPKHGADGGGPYVDPFAADKPLFKITAENMAQYADKLDPGTKEMFRRFPKTWYVNVYPTRRSACFKSWVYENTIKRVMNPKLVGAPNWALTGAQAQFPFPIPKTGAEVMWNFVTNYADPLVNSLYKTFYVDSSGQKTLVDANFGTQTRPYWDNSITSPLPDDKPYYVQNANQQHPPASNGVGMLLHYYLRPDMRGQPVWSYIPGQRRVRLAPEFAYDGVAPSAGGSMLFDEGGGFMGRMDRFDFKLLGRQEMYVPYNGSEEKLTYHEEVLTPNHPDPAAQRWELHRMWVVQADLRPGERHVQKQKMLYVDEDSWQLSIYVGIDHAGKPMHMYHNHLAQAYEVPYMTYPLQVLYDFAKGSYDYWLFEGPLGGYQAYGSWKVKSVPASMFTAEGMQGRGVR